MSHGCRECHTPNGCVCREAKKLSPAAFVLKAGELSKRLSLRHEEVREARERLKRAEKRLLIVQQEVETFLGAEQRLAAYGLEVP